MKTVLLVDDSRAVRLAASKIVESLGFKALEAGDGQEALDVLRENPQTDVSTNVTNSETSDPSFCNRLMRLRNSRSQ